MRKDAWFACAIAATAGCRIGFDDVPSLGSDAAVDAAPDHTCDPTAEFGTPVRITELDPGGEQGTLRLLPNELRGYFWAYGTGSDADLYVVTRPDLDTPFTVTPLTSVNTSADELDPTPNDADTELVLRHHDATGDDIYVATRTSTSEEFGAATVVRSLQSTKSEVQPFLKPGGSALIFARSGGSATHDLFIAIVAGDGEILGAGPIDELATTNEEGDPVMTADARTIYFRSDRDDPGAGGNDIYVATRSDAQTPFGAATVVPHVNSIADDGPSWISPDGCRLYLSSAREGMNAVYVATRGH